MKKLMTVQEIEGEGLLALLGQKVTLFCANYIYAGELVGVNDTCVLLKDAVLVYVTGPFQEKGFKTAEKLNEVWYVTTNSIESFGTLPYKQ